MSFTSVPLLATGDWIDAAWGNTYWRDNFAAVWPYTTAGDIAYAAGATSPLSRLALTTGGVLYGGASAPAWLAKPSVDSVLKNTSAGVPSWTAISDLSNEFASVYHNTTQNYSTGTYAAMLFNSEYSDVPGWHSTSVNTSRMTIITTGYYQASCTFKYSATGGSGFYWDTVDLRVNGGAVADDRRMHNVDAFSKIFAVTFPILAMTAGQYAEIYLEQNSGGTRAVQANAAFSLMRVA